MNGFFFSMFLNVLNESKAKIRNLQETSCSTKMAGQQVFISASENVMVSSVNEYNKFKKEVQTKLKWDRPKWASVREENSKFHKLCNTVNYCRRHLDDAFDKSTMFITLYNVDKEAYIDLKALFLAVQSLIPTKSFLGYYRPRNRRVIALDFDSPETKQLMQEKLIEIAGNWVVDLEWATKSQDIELRLHWLHRRITDARIGIFLAKYMTVNTVVREQAQYTVNSKVENSHFTLKATLHPGVSMDDVPHITYLGGLQTLITIQGRVAMCLGCETLGHIAAKCPRPYCKICKLNRPKRHLCNPPEAKASYAAAVHNVERNFREHEISDSEGSESSDMEEEGEVEPTEEDRKFDLQQSSNFPPLSDVTVHVTNTNTTPPPLSSSISSGTEKLPPPPLNVGLPINNIGKVHRMKTRTRPKTVDSTKEDREDGQEGEDSKANKKLKASEGNSFTVAKKNAVKIKTYANSENLNASIASPNPFDLLMESDSSNPENLFS